LYGEILATKNDEINISFFLVESNWNPTLTDHQAESTYFTIFFQLFICQ